MTALRLRTISSSVCLGLKLLTSCPPSRSCLWVSASVWGDLAGAIQAQQERGKKPTSKQTSDLLDFQLDLLEHYVPGITDKLDDDMFMA